MAEVVNNTNWWIFFSEEPLEFKEHWKKTQILINVAHNLIMVWFSFEETG